MKVRAMVRSFSWEDTGIYFLQYFEELTKPGGMLPGF